MRRHATGLVIVVALQGCTASLNHGTDAARDASFEALADEGPVCTPPACRPTDPHPDDQPDGQRPHPDAMSSPGADVGLVDDAATRRDGHLTTDMRADAILPDAGDDAGWVADALSPDAVRGPLDGPLPDPAPSDALAPPPDGPPPAEPDVALPDATPPPLDSDGDGVPDPIDLCPATPDHQRDADGDGLGDACDRGDTDGDALPDTADPCPRDPAPTEDADADGVGDRCDLCPASPDPAQLDSDADAIGDACEIPGDDDADGAPDDRDVCPGTPDPAQLDRDGDGQGDLCDHCPMAPDPMDADSDGDGAGDACDVCPFVPESGTDHLDVDGDAVPACAGDCDDDDPIRAPDRAERCDGSDNDCDGQVDEIFLDLGLPCAAGIGACRVEGAMRCAGGTTACDAVAGLPVDEVCNGGDDDCDGTADEDVPGCCDPGTELPCGQETGECRVGVQLCDAARAWGPCSGLGPSGETCNGLDDDCDGATDEEQGERDCGVGRCLHRVPTCDFGGQRPCQPLLGAVAEVCNGVDDDCDGQIDDGLGFINCGCGVQVPACAAGSPGACPPPADVVTPERCDGVDNDCNGLVDDVHGVPTVRHTVFEGPGGIAFPPQVALNDGRFLILWTNGQGLLHTVVADTDGAPLGPARSWPNAPAGYLHRVVAGPNGGFGAFWLTSGPPTSNAFAAIDADGTLGPILVPAGAIQVQSVPQALASDGVNFSVAWSISNGPMSVQFMPVDADGRPLAAPRVLGNAIPSGLQPALAWNGASYGFAYLQISAGGYSVVFQHVDRNGLALSIPFDVVPRARLFSSPRLAWTGAGYVVSWVYWDGQTTWPALLRLAANGVPVSAAEVPIPGTLSNIGIGVVGTDVGYAAFAYRTAPTAGSILRRFDFNGRPQGAPEVVFGGSVWPDALVWTGSVLATAWSEAAPGIGSRVVLALGEAACGL